MPEISIGQPVRNGALTGNTTGGALAVVVLAILRRYGWEFTPEEAVALGVVLTGVGGVLASFWAAQQVRGPRTFTVHDDEDASEALAFVNQRRERRRGSGALGSVTVTRQED